MELLGMYWSSVQSIGNYVVQYMANAQVLGQNNDP